MNCFKVLLSFSPFNFYPVVFFFFLFFFSSFSSLPSNAKSVDSEEILFAEKYLHMYEGYVKPEHAHGSSRIDPTTTEEFQNSVLHLQKMAGLEQTGKLNDETIKKMKQKRCGNPDRLSSSLPLEAADARRKRYSTHFDWWQKMHLTYTITAYTNDISIEKIENIFIEALNIWSEHSPLTFERVSFNADLRIKFATGNHGDIYPFDNKGSVLAHAFYPFSSLEGEVHFNDAVKFTVNEGSNLLQIAVHEIGHALGLHHSDIPEAIMTPFFEYRTSFALHQDDKDGIQYLYGPKPVATTSTTKSKPTTSVGVTAEQATTKTTTTKVDDTTVAVTTEAAAATTTMTTTTVPQTTSSASTAGASTVGSATTQKALSEVCQLNKFDAIMGTYDNYLYVFVKDLVYKLDETASTGSHLQEGYPKLISEEFFSAPSNIDAALYVGDRSYIIKGDTFWVYDQHRNLLAPSPGKINKDGFYGVPFDIDSAFVYSGNYMVYFTKGNEYYRYDFYGVDDSLFPQSLNNFLGVPYSIDGAALFYNGYTYFFESQNFYRIDDFNAAVFEDYPKNFFQEYFGCPKVGDNSKKPNNKEGIKRTGELAEPKIFDPERLKINMKKTHLVYVKESQFSSSVKVYANSFLLAISLLLSQIAVQKMFFK